MNLILNYKNILFIKHYPPQIYIYIYVLWMYIFKTERGFVVMG